MLSLQARERGLDQGKVCGEKVPEEDVWLGGAGTEGPEVASLAREEVQKKQQLCPSSQNPPEIPTRRWERVPRQPLRRYCTVTPPRLSEEIWT